VVVSFTENSSTFARASPGPSYTVAVGPTVAAASRTVPTGTEKVTVLAPDVEGPVAVDQVAVEGRVDLVPMTSMEWWKDEPSSPELP
jgi:hypothetical protein